jgi:hypothetical protein
MTSKELLIKKIDKISPDKQEGAIKFLLEKLDEFKIDMNKIKIATAKTQNMCS